MSKSKNKDAEAYDREYDSFLKQLEEFHQQRGTPFKRLPRINGKGVDLYLLYVVVTARGGWQKVNSRNEWDEILEDFRLPGACVNSATALKHIYIRYLDAYERINYLGEDGDERNSEATYEDEDTRTMRAKKNIRSLNNVPLSYNINQHNVQENQRSAYLLSTDLYKSTPYDKVALSLISPLPNEHDFAFNICTILSNEGRHAMQLAQYPRIVEFMLAHTGVFKDVETQKYFLSSYKEAKGKSLVQFWVDSVADKKNLELLSAVIKVKPSGESIDSVNSNTDQDTKKVSVSGDQGKNDGARIVDNERLRTEHNNNCNKITSIENSCESLIEKSDVTSDKGNIINSESSVVAKDSLKKDPQIQQLEKILGCDGDFTFDPDSAELFQTGRDSGTQDPEGTRIAQVLHIIRNLSFEEHNVATLAKSQTLLRFLVLCICSRWGGLAVNALDTLGNIAPEVRLYKPKTDPCTAMMLSTVSEGVASPDRAMVLRSLEVLNKLAINDPNEEVLNENIDAKVLAHIWNYLTIHDIMLLIYTLECLYSLSSLGSPLCNNIVHATGSIHTLISLLTVEAQSYGPEACIGMKVVETVTGVVSEPETPPPAPLPLSNNTTLLSIPPTVNTVPANATANLNTQNPFNTMIGGTPVLPKTPLAPKMPLNPKNISTPLMGTPKDPQKIAGRIVPPEVEEFVKQWVLQNYEGCPTNAIEQAIVYRHFAAAMHSLGKKQGLNPVLLSNCVRKVFGTGVGPSRRPVGDGIEKWHYNGIRKKDGVVIPPMPDKKKPMVPVMGSNVGRIGMYSPTPVVVSHNNLSQVNRNIQKQQLLQPDQDSNSDSLRKTATFNGVKEDSNSYLTATLNDKRVTSFEGILQNGIKSEEDIKDEKKNVLADLLEKTVGGEMLNGVVEQDVRIGDKGLQFVKVNSQITSNGNSIGSENIQGGIKRSATPDNSPAKRMALEVPQGAPNGNDSGRITLYVSQNGNESGEVISSGQQQVILSQGQQGTVPVSGGQQVILSQGQQSGITTQSQASQGQQQVITSTGSQQVIVNSQGTVVSGQTMVTPQGQVILQRPPGSQTGGVIMQQGSQIIAQGGAPGQVIQQVIQAGGAGQPQKVILHQGQLGQVLGGQVILSQNTGGQQVVLQGGNNLQGQVLVPGQVNNSSQLVVQASGTTTQGIGQQYIVSQGGSGGQTVMVSANSQVGAAGQQVVTTAQGQTMIVTSGSQGQPMMVNTTQGQGGQLMVSGNPSGGGQILLAPQQSGQAGKTLIILPNQHKMVLAGGGQQQGVGQQQLVLPRQVGGQQVVQVVSAPSNTSHTSPTTPVRAIRAGVPHIPATMDSQRISSPPTSSTLHTSNVVLSNSLPTAIAPAPAGPTAVPVSQTTSPAPPPPHIPAPQVLSSGVAKRKSTGLQYLCEWRGCNQIFGSAAQVYHHACKIHCPIRLNEIQCQWAGCDTMTRKRFSAMTHLHDRHCNEQLLHILAVRRNQLSTLGKTDIPVPQAPPPHPGYAPNAAFHAIKRHALEVISQRDAVEKEGPVTKSIRLTSALILRNLVIYSNSGKKLLRGYESELANVALSGMESSRTVAQILYDIHLPDTVV